jgi:hypothetical protein
VGVHVLVDGKDAVELAQAIVIEPSDHHTAPAHQALTLRHACGQQGCNKLLVGTEMTAPRELGVTEPAPCSDAQEAALDRRFVPSKAGEYVLTVRSCDGSSSAQTRFRWTPP